MAVFDLYNIQNEVTGAIELDDSVFAAPVNPVFLHQVLVSYQANRRQGTVKTKSRCDMTGTHRKPFRQKGTGRARQGFAQAPQYRGGATQFGPQPRSYRKTITKKMKQEAFRQCLSLKASRGEFTVLGALRFDEIKTRQAAGLLKAFGTQGKVLFVDVEPQDNALLSIRNLARAELLSIGSCSPFDIFTADRIFLTQAAAELYQQRYARQGGPRHES
ncbi:MAG: 50S ribosomal protein L4 [bacterium]